MRISHLAAATTILIGSATLVGVVPAAQAQEAAQPAAMAPSGVPSDVDALCYSPKYHQSWVGMTAGRCKAAGGTRYTLAKNGTKIAEVDLSKVKPIYGEKLPSLSCTISGASLVLSIPGQPGSVAGWVLKGSQLALGAAGVATSC